MADRYYVWYYQAKDRTDEDAPSLTGYIRSDSSETASVSSQLYKFLGEGYNITWLQLLGVIEDVLGHREEDINPNYETMRADLIP